MACLGHWNREISAHNKTRIAKRRNGRQWGVRKRACHRCRPKRRWVTPALMTSSGPASPYDPPYPPREPSADNTWLPSDRYGNSDSGGPAYVLKDGEWLLAGATSRATSNSVLNCGDGGIYARVDQYQKWIVETAKANGGKLR